MLPLYPFGPRNLFSDSSDKISSVYMEMVEPRNKPLHHILCSAHVCVDRSLRPRWDVHMNAVLACDVRQS